MKGSMALATPKLGGDLFFRSHDKARLMGFMIKPPGGITFCDPCNLKKATKVRRNQSFAKSFSFTFSTKNPFSGATYVSCREGIGREGDKKFKQ